MNKTILITGSTDGIGKLTALQLAKAGHTVFFHGRKPEKLAHVIEEIKQQSGNNNINGFVADFSDLSAVKEMAQVITNEVNQLDVLINNAGVFNSPVAQNKDGLDLRYVVNYLAPYVLTDKLLALLQKSPAARIINLSSAAQDPVSYAAMSGQEQLPERATYGQSKLALTMWSFWLAKELTDITVIPVNPGSLLNTNMVREAFGQFWSSADKGAQILFDLSVSEQYEGITGQYFDNDQGAFGKAHPDAYDEAKIDQLLQATKNILATI